MNAPRRRPHCSVFIAVSLDGYIARKDGNLDWLKIVEHSGEDYGFKKFYDSVDALIDFRCFPARGKQQFPTTNLEEEK